MAGGYLRFLFDQLQTFRFWAMSRDLSWLEVFSWSNDQVEMQRHEIEHCWMLILVHFLTFSIFDIQSSDFLVDFKWSMIKRSISFFKSSDLQMLFMVLRRSCQIGLPPNPSICSPFKTRNNYHCLKSHIIHHFRRKNIKVLSHWEKVVSRKSSRSILSSVTSLWKAGFYGILA